MTFVTLSLFWGEAMHASIVTADREPTIDQSTVTTEVQFGMPMSFTRVAYRSMGKGLQEQK